MYAVKGACAEALITIDDLDLEALTQLYGLLNAKASEGSRVAIMPDGQVSFATISRQRLM